MNLENSSHKQHRCGAVTKGEGKRKPNPEDQGQVQDDEKEKEHVASLRAVHKGSEDPRS